MKLSKIKNIAITSLMLLVVVSTGFSQSKKSCNHDLPVFFPLSISDFVKISSLYGYRNHPVLNKFKKHNGVDLVAEEGKPVYATANGTVTKASYDRGYGNHVIIEHKGDAKTLYGHLRSLKVRKGQKIKRGDILGYVGQTGLATGPHLHYEMWIKDIKVDPFIMWKLFLKKSQQVSASLNDHHGHNHDHDHESKGIEVN